MNFNMFSMASRQDLDNWAELGNTGWDFDSLTSYYRKFESYHPSSETLAAKMSDKYLDKSLRGTSGPIHVSPFVRKLNIVDFDRFASQTQTLLGAKMYGPRL